MFICLIEGRKLLPKNLEGLVQPSLLNSKDLLHLAAQFPCLPWPEATHLQTPDLEMI